MRRAANRNRSHQAAPEVSSRCGKRAYPDWNTAKTMAKLTSRQVDEPMQPYRCMRCNTWHVGTTPPKSATRRRA